MFEVIVKTPETTGIRFAHTMLSVSSAILGGGVQRVDAVINHTLGNNWPDFAEMKPLCRQLALQQKCDPDKTIVLLTAVPQEYGAWSQHGYCFVTAGLGNAITLFPENIWDEKATRVYTPGTINSISILEEAVTEAALVEAYGAVKVAIALTMGEWGKLHRKDEQSYVGTQTDCSVVLCPINNNPLAFAGLSTKVGNTAAKEVQSALFHALSHKYPLCKQFCINKSD